MIMMNHYHLVRAQKWIFVFLAPGIIPLCSRNEAMTMPCVDTVVGLALYPCSLQLLDATRNRFLNRMCLCGDKLCGGWCRLGVLVPDGAVEPVPGRACTSP